MYSLVCIFLPKIANSVVLALKDSCFTRIKIASVHLTATGIQTEACQYDMQLVRLCLIHVEDMKIHLKGGILCEIAFSVYFCWERPNCTNVCLVELFGYND